ncbi:MAG: transporter [Verrucomicrobia bacterium]|nr:transporter [Verrucomicrobiota bacterium]
MTIIFLNPVLQIEDGKFDMNTYALKYIRSFELFDKSARIDITQNYQSGDWSGLQAGQPISTARDGWADTTVRFAINLLGAPPLAGKEFAEYRAHADCETIIGAGLAVDLPTGEYFDDKLINLGNNRFAFRPQLGLVHQRGKWTGELTTSARFFTDNEDFFNGKRLQEYPGYFAQGHLIYNFTPGLWLSASMGYFFGGESTIDGTSSDDRQSDLGWALSMGIPITRNFGLKLTYIGIRTLTNTGSDTDTLALGCSVMW